MIHLLSREETLYKPLVILGLLLTLTGCSVEKNTGTTRFYHGLTARYNIYFNGYESYRAGIRKINSGYRDDYAELIRVFESDDPESASLCSSDMEKAVQKASKLISLKSITARPEFNPRRDLSEKEKQLLQQKEFNEWVDDSYFLIGKARYYKHEFDEAAAVFNHSIENANDPDIKREALIWLARISAGKGAYNEALRLLENTGEVGESDKAFRAFYYSALADLYIRQKRYQEAIGPLTRAVDYVSGKRSKYRLTYLLAQLHNLNGDPAKAAGLFRNVINMNPPYDVEFNARINIAGVFDVNSGEDPQSLVKELEKMLRDSKNTDYRDQIYFALGNISMKEGREKEAVDFYRNSVRSGSVNQNQRGRSYLALAVHYFGKPDYIEAGRYYDSAAYFMDQKHPDYLSVKTMADNLGLLTENLLTIRTQDSLRKVAAMSPAQRNELINGIIASIMEQERTSSPADQGRYNLGEYYESERRFADNIAQEGSWYFYNQAALAFGRTEFRKRWGDRRLEDNWRRANRSMTGMQQTASGTDETTASGNDSASVVPDNKKPAYYLKDLPLNDSLLKLSEENTALAYLNAGKIFDEKFSKTAEASASYETLLTRFPGSFLEPETLYNLNKLFSEQNPQRAEAYRQRLVSLYPGSEFALILSDPDYRNRKLAEAGMIQSLYSEAYNAYLAEDDLRALEITEKALSDYPGNDLALKFMLLKAYVIGRTGDLRKLTTVLDDIIRTGPDTGEGKKALELRAFLDKEAPEIKIEEDKQIAATLFDSDTTAQLSFGLVITDNTININQVSFDVISYNIDNYTNRNFRTEGSLTDDRYVIVYVSGFSGNSEAWDYFRAFSPARVLRNASATGVMTFLISSGNRAILENDKNPERYLLFFRDNYLNSRE